MLQIILLLLKSYIRFMKKLISVLIVAVWLITVSVSVMMLFKKEEDKKVETLILELWQLDMVEGGKGSRRNYLLSAAKEFENKYDNVLLTVISQTAECAEEMFKNGVYPDMISYSQGLDGVFPLCQEITGFGVSYGGKYKNALYALPWAYGGYFLIERDGLESPSQVYVSKTDSNLPLLAAFLEGLTLNNPIEMPSEQSYYAFLKDKNSALLGTQRDIYRLENKDMSLKITPLKNYTDIVQYVSVMKGDSVRTELCNDFIKILVEKSQKDINLLGMASPFGNEKLIDNGPIALLFTVKHQMTASAFLSKETLSEINSVIKDQTINSDNKMKYVKNTIIYLK